MTVQLDKTEQTIEGFGINTALGGGITWDPAFSLTGTDGIGLSIVRVGMNPDGSLSGDLSGAKSHNAKVIGSVWSAPANCKTNGTTQKGGHLISNDGGKCYDSFSTTIANFAKNQGLYAMGAANEPDFASCASIGPPCTVDYDSMVYTAKEMVAFIKVLGPKLKAAGVKLIAPEPSEWIHLWSNTSATGSTVASHPNSSDPLNCGCFGNSPVTTGCASTCTQGNGYDYGHWLAQDATAWAAIDILATHEYDSQKAEPWPADVDGGKRSKDDLGDRGVRREVLAGSGAVERHQQWHCGRRLDSLCARRRPGFGLALVVVQGEQQQRQRRFGHIEQPQALLHAW